MPDFFSRIVEIRQSKKMLQKDVAEAIGISIRQYQRYEKAEQQPTLPIIIKLADYFGVSADYLLGRSDNPQQN
ncbi:MAG: helix-turn-helix domain-containing protein [Defluviitaleaceae bacterium]|nr:helix-turn-helix domain-containing protein [Defluviitaleaceae bacterium]